MADGSGERRRLRFLSMSNPTINFELVRVWESGEKGSEWHIENIRYGGRQIYIA